MPIKYGNYVNGRIWGNPATLKGLSGVTATSCGYRTYNSFCDIEQWIVRNLMTNKNCLIRNKLYSKIKNQLDILFNKNVTARPDNDGCVVIEVNDDGVEFASKWVCE